MDASLTPQAADEEHPNRYLSSELELPISDPATPTADFNYANLTDGILANALMPLISMDGSTVVIRSNAGALGQMAHVYDVGDGSLTSFGGLGVLDYAISADGSTIAVITAAVLSADDTDGEPTAYLWDRSTGRYTYIAPGVEVHIDHIGETVVFRTFRKDGVCLIRRWRRATKSITDLNCGSERSTGSSLSGDGMTFAYQSSGEIRIVDLDSGSVLRSVSGLSPALTFDGSKLAMLDEGAIVILIEISTGFVVSSSATGIRSLGDEIAISPDGSIVAFATDGWVEVGPIPEDRTWVSLWDTETGAVHRIPEGADGRSWAPSIAGDNRTIVFTSTASNLGPANGSLHDVFITWSPNLEFQHTITQRAMGRRANPSELNHWQPLLASSQGQKAEFIAGLLSSEEYREQNEPIARLYQTYFDRLPDSGGMAYWSGIANGGTSLLTISYSFSVSQEFQVLYGDTDRREFITLVYRNVLHRTPDQDGYDYWLAQMDAGLTEYELMLYFSLSDEFQTTMREPLGVASVYLIVVNRAPSGAELKDGVSQLRYTGSLASIATELLGSDEMSPS